MYTISKRNDGTELAFKYIIVLLLVKFERQKEKLKWKM